MAALLSRKKFSLNNCIEQSFFKAIILIALVGCGIVLVFDLFLVKHGSYSVELVSLLIQVLLLTLYSLDKIDFGKITTGVIIAMAIMFTYRGMITDDFNEITCTLLITVGFICSLVSKGVSRNTLKVIILICLVMVLFKGWREQPFLLLFRHAIPYLISFSIVTICSGLLKTKYENNQVRLKEMVDLLNKKNQKINDQNALLKKNYNELSDLNQNLEAIIDQKTHKIAEKNKQLGEIAYANAHQIRGPLARILGLLNLINMEPGKKDFYLCKINEQANEMDDTLLKVTKSIETNIHK
jgi:signal transduction histidine kinase